WPVLHRRDTERGARKLTVSLMTAGACSRPRVPVGEARGGNRRVERRIGGISHGQRGAKQRGEGAARRSRHAQNGRGFTSGRSRDAQRADLAARQAEAEALRAELVLMCAEAESQHSIHAAEEQALLAELSVHRDAMLASTTWRVTAPLRWLGTPSAVSEHFSELIGCPISRSLPASCVCLELRSLPSAGVTRFQRYYEPLRHPRAPGLSLAGGGKGPQFKTDARRR